MNEYNHKLSEARKGKHWYNNGEINTYAKECPEGYVPGKLVKLKPNMRWWNNGEINLQAVKCPGEDWHLGKLGSFDIEDSTYKLQQLYNKLSLAQLARYYNTSIPKIRGLLRRRGIINKYTGEAYIKK